MKIRIDNMQDAQEAAKLGGVLLSSALTLYTITRKAIADSKNMDVADKDQLLKKLDAMRLPEWDNL